MEVANGVGVHELQKEKERVSKMNDDKAKKVLIDYINHMARMQKSPRRQVFLSSKIRVLHENLPEGIIPLSDANMKMIRLYNPYRSPYS